MQKPKILKNNYIHKRSSKERSDSGCKKLIDKAKGKISLENTIERFNDKKPISKWSEQKNFKHTEFKSAEKDHNKKKPLLTGQWNTYRYRIMTNHDKYKDHTLADNSSDRYKGLKTNRKAKCAVLKQYTQEVDINFYVTQDSTLQKEYQTWTAAYCKKSNPKIITNRFHMLSESNKKKNKSNSSSKNSCREVDNSMYKSPGKLKAKAKNSQLLNDGTSSEKAMKKLKISRIKNRRRTNPEYETASKFLLTAKKEQLTGNFSPNCDTPKTINCSSKISSMNNSSKESMNIKDKHKKLQINDELSPEYLSEKVFESRKNSTQANKISKIMLSPSNRIMLKPRKTKKNMFSSKIKLIAQTY